MTKIHISPFDDTTKKRLLKAVADRGQAAGLKAAASILKEMADGHDLAVPLSTVYDLADILREKAKKIKTVADLEISEMEKIC